MTHPALVYGLFAYAITWLAVSPLVAEALGLLGVSVPDGWHAFGALGPAAGAYLAARFGGGRDAVRDLTRAAMRFRIPLRWWLVALGSPIGLLAIAVVAARVATGNWDVAGFLDGAAARGSWWLAVAVPSLAYGIGEEPGWRGFLLPTLMRRRSALTATLITAAVWAAWHAPFFTYRYDFSGPGTVVGFFVAMAAGALWLTFLYLSTGGSLPAVAAWHAVWNLVNFAAAEMSALTVGILNAGMMVLGFGVLLAVGPGLRWPRTHQA